MSFVGFALGVMVGIALAVCGLVFTWLCEDYLEAHPHHSFKSRW